MALGRDPGRVFIDVAYICTMGEDVAGIVPEQAGLKSDVTEHEVFVSCIKHF